MGDPAGEEGRIILATYGAAKQDTLFDLPKGVFLRRIREEELTDFLPVWYDFDHNRVTSTSGFWQSVLGTIARSYVDPETVLRLRKGGAVPATIQGLNFYLVEEILKTSPRGDVDETIYKECTGRVSLQVGLYLIKEIYNSLIGREASDPRARRYNQIWYEHRFSLDQRLADEVNEVRRKEFERKTGIKLVEGEQAVVLDTYPKDID